VQPVDYSQNPMGGSMRPPVEYLRVGFGKRLLAVVLDGIMMVALIFALAMVLVNLGVRTSMISSEEIDQLYGVYTMLGIPESQIDYILEIVQSMSFTSVIVGLLYSMIELAIGSSPGKLVFGLKIAHADGRRGNVALFAKRWAVKHISSLLNFIALLPALAFFDYIAGFASFVIFIGCFFALGEARMALHDRVAQTAVFHKEDIQ